jgi:hypothetical protein
MFSLQTVCWIHVRSDLGDIETRQRVRLRLHFDRPRRAGGVVIARVDLIDAGLGIRVFFVAIFAGEPGSEDFILTRRRTIFRIMRLDIEFAVRFDSGSRISRRPGSWIGVLQWLQNHLRPRRGLTLHEEFARDWIELRAFGTTVAAS